MTKPNIFKISHRIGLEDKLTSSLAYILNKHPAVGQAYLDQICKLSNLKMCKFKEAIDHPEGDAENRPDFLIRSTGVEILFEHKVDSELGERQLERYLKLAKAAGQKLCFISNRKAELATEVISNASYLNPGFKNRPYFLWSDFYELFGSFNIDIVTEFQEWMTDLGMNPHTWPDHGDPFSDDDATQEFYSCARDLKSLIDCEFGKLARRAVKPGTVNPCIAISKALPDVYLLYITLRKSGELTSDNFSTELSVIGNQIDFLVITEKPSLFSKNDGSITSILGKVQFLNYLEPVKEFSYSEACSVRSYLFPLKNILNSSLERTKSNLELVTLEVLRHLKSEADK